MSFFTCILILICIYCPRIVPVAFIIGLMFYIYSLSAVLFWIIIAVLVAFCIYAVCSTK